MGWIIDKSTHSGQVSYRIKLQSFFFLYAMAVAFSYEQITHSKTAELYFLVNWFLQLLPAFVLVVITYSRLSSVQKYFHAAPSSSYRSEKLPSTKLSRWYCFLFLFPLRTTLLLLSGGGTRINKMNKKNRFFLYPWNLSFYWGIQIFENFSEFFFSF